MDGFAAMFSLGRGGGRANDTTQGSRNDGNDTWGGRNDGMTGAPTGARRTSGGGGSLDDWDNVSNRTRDDPSAPNLGVRFGASPPGDRTAADMAAQDNIFSLEGGGGSMQMTPLVNSRHRRRPKSSLNSGPRTTRRATAHRRANRTPAGVPS